jgi:hypothetical protein
MSEPAAAAQEHAPDHAAPEHADGAAAPAATPAPALSSIGGGNVSLSDMASSIGGGGGAAAGESMGKVSRSASDVAQGGFSGSAGPVPHLKEMEKSFGGADFSGVKSYSDGPARSANKELGANAYAAGNSIAFSTPNPSKALVAHELTHVVQNGHGNVGGGGGGGGAPQASGADGDGIERGGEHEAEAVEAAVGAGKPAASALTSSSKGGGGPAASKKKGPQREGAGDWTAGMTFSKEGMESSGAYSIWPESAKVSIPIVACPGLFAEIVPDVSVKGSLGAKNDGAFTAKLGLEGSVQMGLSYGVPELAQIYGGGALTASGGFEYSKKGKEWSLEGGIGLSAALVIGVRAGNSVIGHIDYNTQLVGTDIGKLTGISWKNGKFEREKVGWAWSANMLQLFASVKAAVEKVKKIIAMGVNAAKTAVNAAKKGAKAVYQAGADVGNFISHHW